ncbi:hypothetical protein [Burkholderia oklahomensis]|uniref:hypothetical protein n=1 Tax=Burkholderia oklahomensis TaxID=342113 RepID=UPI0003129643|nr:hypothetical protein [Burkholderia oklahomensis]
MRHAPMRNGCARVAFAEPAVKRRRNAERIASHGTAQRFRCAVSIASISVAPMTIPEMRRPSV